jgi:GT2 family glycosyltransferase
VKVDIVIVNWNSANLLAECLKSIHEYGGSLVAKVIVVDNASTDGSLSAGEFGSLPQLEVIRNRENVGFARACNMGASRASSEYLLFLNPDARLLPGSLMNAVRALVDRAQHGIMIVGAQLIDESGSIARSCSRLPNATQFALHALGADRLLPKLAHPMREWDHIHSREVEHVIGAFLLIRSTAFRDLSGFDEQFFVYLEDLDLSQRAARRGWKTWFESTAVAFHVGGGTSRQAKPERLFYSLRSRLLYSRKHFGYLSYCFVASVTLCVEPASRLLAAALNRDAAMARETLGGYGYLWPWFLAGGAGNRAAVETAKRARER